jgi:hypothetical protein
LKTPLRPTTGALSILLQLPALADPEKYMAVFVLSSTSI